MRLGRVEVTGGFFLLIAWMNYLDRQGLVPLTLWACFLHECGHYLALLSIGKRLSLVRLTAIGAQMYLKGHLTYLQECFVAASGPVMNVLLAYGSVFLLHSPLFAGINLSLALFNLLPIGQLDGSRVLHCLLCQWGSPEAAAKIMSLLGRLLSVLIWFLGVLFVGIGGNFTLLIVSTWLLIRTFSPPVSKINAQRIEIGLVRKKISG